MDLNELRQQAQEEARDFLENEQEYRMGYIDKDQLIKDNNFYRSFSENELCKMILIDDSYEIPFDEI